MTFPAFLQSSRHVAYEELVRADTERDTEAIKRISEEIDRLDQQYEEARA